MTPHGSAAMPDYELPLPGAESLAGGAPHAAGGESLPEAMLLRNVLWFCRLRWVITAVLAGFGILGLFPGAVRLFGLHAPGIWPFVTAGVLFLGNLVFLATARRPNAAIVNLWAQIVLDLLVLTAVVHFFGGTKTYAPFTYLFHIVLACVFFSRSRSLTVTLIASLLFVACGAAEHAGILTSGSIFAGAAPQGSAALPRTLVVNSLSAIAIWLVVWYLASHLSEMVRRQGWELAKSNRRLVAAREERTRHMLTTTHQLKAPFAAIHANAQLLLKGHCGALPDEAADVVRRIAARCNRLAREIQDMLQLANLGSLGQQAPPRVTADVAGLLGSCVEQVQPMAQQRGIALDVDLHPAPATGAEDHLKMLLINLLSNAVTYSHEGGRVRVRCGRGPGGSARVSIADEGIGIPPDKLPRIFEEHYRTNEAVRHNKESSGLGLAIVRRVAERYHIHLRVKSRPGAGTTFELWFPPVRPAPGASAMKENQDAIRDDCG